jgi:hypothetical protein
MGLALNPPVLGFVVCCTPALHLLERFNPTGDQPLSLFAHMLTAALAACCAVCACAGGVAACWSAAIHPKVGAVQGLLLLAHSLSRAQCSGALAATLQHQLVCDRIDTCQQTMCDEMSSTRYCICPA